MRITGSMEQKSCAQLRCRLRALNKVSAQYSLVRFTVNIGRTVWNLGWYPINKGFTVSVNILIIIYVRVSLVPHSAGHHYLEKPSLLLSCSRVCDWMVAGLLLSSRPGRIKLMHVCNI